MMKHVRSPLIATLLLFFPLAALASFNGPVDDWAVFLALSYVPLVVGICVGFLLGRKTKIVSRFVMVLLAIIAMTVFFSNLKPETSVSLVMFISFPLPLGVAGGFWLGRETELKFFPNVFGACLVGLLLVFESMFV